MAQSVTTKVVNINPAETAVDLDISCKEQASQALIMEAYCHSVLAQPPVDLAGLGNVQQYQDTINKQLSTAQANAEGYLKNILPSTIQSLANVTNYYYLENAIGVTIPPNTTLEKEQWIQALSALGKQAVNYENQCILLSKSLGSFHAAMTQDAKSLSNSVKRLNKAIKGDYGVLAQLEDQINKVQSDINGALGKITTSGIAIVGGSILIGVGAVTEQAEAVAGGVGIVAGGVGGEVEAAKELDRLNNEKAKLITEKSILQSQIKTLSMITSGIQSLSDRIACVVNSSKKLEKIWLKIENDIISTITGLKNGSISVEKARALYVTEPKDSITKLLQDIETIKTNMGSVTIIMPEKGETLDQAMMKAIKSQQGNDGGAKNSDAKKKGAKNSGTRAKKTVALSAKSPSQAKALSMKTKRQAMLSGSTMPLLRSVNLASTSLTTSTSGATGMGDKNKAQVGTALIIQTYCNSVKAQPTVNFDGLPHLATYQQQINSGLATAQSHADNYLNNIQPAIITNMTNIANYYQLYDAVPTACPEGSTTAQWLSILGTLKTQAATYETAAGTIATTLGTLSSDLTTDQASFAKTVTELNAAVNGDNGVLDSINGQLDSIQSKIDGAIAGTVLSGLAIVGGGFMIAAGAIGDFITAGASTPLAVAGVGVVAAGTAGEVASAITLKNLNNEKATLLSEKANLTAEVQLATGVSRGYKSLSNQVANAVNAATAMQNEWNALKGDLSSLESDLQNGIISPGGARTLFLTAANSTVATVLKDIGVIKEQMAGVSTVKVPQGQTVGEALVAAAQANSGSTTTNFMSLAAMPKLTGVSSIKSIVNNVGSDGDEKSDTSLLKLGSGISSMSMAAIQNGSGLLSQSMNNMIAAESSIKGLQGLPSAAQSIQASSSTIISSIVSQIGGIQSKVSAYVPAAQSTLNGIVSLLSQQKSDSLLTQIKQQMSTLNGTTSALQSGITPLVQDIGSNSSQLQGSFQQIANIVASLTQQQTSLQGQLNNAQSEKDAAQKRYYYLLALGPFGLAGLAVALGLYLHWKDEVDGYQSQMNSLTAQINAINTMKTQCNTMNGDLSTVVSKVQSVKNSVDFVVSDLTTINNDLNLDESFTVISLAVRAAIAEVTTLATDAA